MNVFASFIAALLKYNTPLLYGTVGEIVTEKSGSLNLGVEGTMAIGAIGGLLIGCKADSLLIGILASFFIAALCGLFFAFMTVTLQANQNVTGLTITTFGLGLYFFIGNGFKSAGKWPDMLQCEGFLESTKPINIPLLSKIPFFGEAFFSQSIFVYLGIIIAVVMWWYLKYTKPGLRIRSVGENPAAADAVGINVTLYKYIHIGIGSGVMGIGGLLMAVNLSGSFEGSKCWIDGYGWISIALVIFAKWNTLLAILGTFVFGIFNTLQVFGPTLAEKFPGVLGWLNKIPPQFMKALPFVITAVVLVITSISNKKNDQPAAIGRNYYREER
ncbi:MAG: ABC transporter permease [Clostridia bacterium]|nr:ABC transporter permease [Clostridia bacterium]MBR3839121.1 ABC transporter permease [Clostridia bacterium]